MILKLSNNDSAEALKAVRQLKEGGFAEVNDLFVLDKILESLDERMEMDLQIFSNGKILDVEMARRLRLRGLDIRPEPK